MTEQDPTTVTKTQNEYLLQLATGLKTTRGIALSLKISEPNAGKIIGKLRNKGLVTSSRIPGTRGNTNTHSLVKPYNELNLIVKSDGRNNGPGKPTSDEEIMYAAILRNAGMTGQELTEQFRKVFPDRTRLSIIKNIIIKARRADLCR